MINKDAKINESARFCNTGDCFIHVEMQDGKNCEVLVAGDGLAILHGIGCVINRMGEKAGIGFTDTIEEIVRIREINANAYKNKKVYIDGKVNKEKIDE